ncbi:unnamed protein product [Rhizophagus irregularis]|nr:unnamed protein product [Rhizophagus irregularis]
MLVIDDLSSLSKDHGLEIKEIKEIKEAFNQKREDKWKARLAELATNSIPLKNHKICLPVNDLIIHNIFLKNLALKIGIN